MALKLATACRRSLGAITLLGGLSGTAMADLTVTQRGTTLTILGDSATPDAITVDGLGGAITVAGQPAAFYGVETLNIDPRAGGVADITLTNVALARGLKICGAAEGTNISLWNSIIQGSTTIRTGNGPDVLQSTDDLFEGSVRIDLGGGANDATLGGTVLNRGAVIDSSAGRDRVILKDNVYATGPVNISTGDGFDTVDISNSLLYSGLNVATGGDADFVYITNGVLVDGANTVVDTAAGNSSLLIADSCVFRCLKIKGGANRDLVQLGCDVWVDLDLQIDTYADEDEVQVAHGIDIGRDLRISTGSGFNRVTLINGTYCSDPRYNVGGNLTVSGGNDDDIVTLYSENSAGVYEQPITVRGDLTLLSGGGADDLTCASAFVAGNLRLDAGDNNDDVWVWWSVVLGNTSISLGRGEDGLEIVDSLLDGARVVLDGGAGVDAATGRFDYYNPVIRLLGFEVLP